MKHLGTVLCQFGGNQTSVAPFGCAFGAQYQKPPGTRQAFKDSDPPFVERWVQVIHSPGLPFRTQLVAQVYVLNLVVFADILDVFSS